MTKQAKTAQPATSASTIVEPTKKTGPLAELWSLWDGIADGAALPRSMMIDLGVANGHNYFTCRTQAQRYLQARKAA